MIQALTKELRILEIRLEVPNKVGIFEKLMMSNTIIRNFQIFGEPAW